MNEDDFLKSLIVDFVQESNDYIKKVEENIIDYENNHSDEIKRKILMDLHSIKGSAQAADLETIADEVHQMENIVGQENSPIDNWLNILDNISKHIKNIKV
ncbi:MAG: Hpt domain-containing protein [Oligoflexales bacterium]